MFPPLVVLFAGILGGAALVYFWDDILGDKTVCRNLNKVVKT